MKKSILIVVLVVFCRCIPGFSQSITRDAQGNYHAASKSQRADSTTGNTYTHSNGKVYPVLQGARGGLYVWIDKKDGSGKRKIYLPKNK